MGRNVSLYIFTIIVISISVTHLSLFQWPLVECPSLLSSVKMILLCEPSRPHDNANLLAERHLPTLPRITGPRPRVHVVMSQSHLTCLHPHLLVPRTLNPLTQPPAFPLILPLPPARLQSTRHLLLSTPSATPHRQRDTATPLHPRARHTTIPPFNPSFPQPFGIIAVTVMQNLPHHPQCNPLHSPVSPPPRPPHFRKLS